MCSAVFALVIVMAIGGTSASTAPPDGRSEITLVSQKGPQPSAVTLAVYGLWSHQNQSVGQGIELGGARSDAGDESALMMAVKRPEVIRYLLKSGTNPNYQNGFGKTALCYAAQYDVLESAKLLIEKGAQVNHALKMREAIESDGDTSTPTSWGIHR